MTYYEEGLELFDQLIKELNGATCKDVEVCGDKCPCTNLHFGSGVLTVDQVLIAQEIRNAIKEEKRNIELPFVRTR